MFDFLAEPLRKMFSRRIFRNLFYNSCTCKKIAHENNSMLNALSTGYPQFSVEPIGKDYLSQKGRFEIPIQ
jgi:hypothetical protein